MKKRLTMLLCAFLVAFTAAVAQTKVSGQVVQAEDGEPVIGAHVVSKSAGVGTVTDVNGKFEINVKPGSNLDITYVGNKPVSARAKQNMVVRMESDKSLDEVIVLGYGSQKKASFTGAASTLKGEDLQKLQVSNLSKALEGTVAGVQISQSSGTPGSAASIIVRGIGSISSSTSPLIILDGVPYEGSLNSIPSQDIESLTVLKDAAANSMYGARGANGVIMITTKGSRETKPRIDFNAKWGSNSRGVGNYDIVRDAGEYYELMYEAYRNSLVPSMGYAVASQYAAQNLVSEVTKYNIYKGVADDALIDPATGKLSSQATTKKWDDDWTKDPFENGLRQEYTASVQAGNENTKAYFSLGYLGDEGYMAGSDFERINARVKVDQKIGKYVRVGANLGYAKTTYQTFGSEGSNYSNIFMFSQSIAPIYPIYFYDQDGNRATNSSGGIYDFGTEYTRPYASEQNPLAVAKENVNKTERDNITSRGYFEVKFLKDFTFTANIAYDVFNSNTNEFATPIGGDAANVGGRGEKSWNRYGALNVNQILDWNRDFGKHNVHLMAVHENKQDHSRYMYGHMTNFSDYSNTEFANAALYQDLTSYTSEYALEGYLFKGEYGYADRYYATASLRRDGSSRFAKDNRWGTFWAVGGAWRLSNEAFFQNAKKVVNDLKIKASYGTQGNDNIGYTHAYSDLYTVSRLSGGNAAFSKTFRGNADLTWEKQSLFNVGFESRFLDRFTLGFDFFIKKNNDMIFASPLAASEGNPSTILRNEVDMKNTGFEIEIGADIIRTKDILWSANLNLSHYKNELTKYPASKPEEEYPDGFQRGSYWWQLGKSIYNWSGYEYLGVDPESGLPMYNKYTDNEDGTKTVTIVNRSSDATYVSLDKSAIPDLTGGFSTSVQGFGFDLSIQTAFQLGGYVRDSYYAKLLNTGEAGMGLHKDVFNRWTPSNTNTNIPALNYESNDAGISSASDYFLTKANYFSLRNITFGYTLPKHITRKAGFEKVRFYFAGDNVWLLSKRKGLDPRQSFSGGTGYNYSAIRTLSLGVDLSL